MLALEQHMPEHGLRLVLALIGGKTKPTCGLARIARSGGSVEVKSGEVVLRVGVAEIRRGVGKHFPGARGVGLLRRVGNAAEIVVAEGDEGIGDVARLRGLWAIVGVSVGD